TLEPITVYSTSNVNKTVSNAFQKSFKGATNPRWYEINQKFLVYFIMKDMKNTALFQKNGNLIYHIKYGTEKNLPNDVRTLVGNSYQGYKIINAINVNQENRDIWVM